MAHFAYFATCFAYLLQFLPAIVYSCGTAPTVASPSTPNTKSSTTPSSLLGSFNNWVRCRPQIAATVICRQVGCETGERHLISPGGVPFYDKNMCEAAAAFEQCYDFSKDGSGIGICQRDYLGCFGSTKIVLATATIDDNTCAHFSLIALLYARCVDKTSGAVICRPDRARCSSNEDWNPLYYAYPTLASCVENNIVAAPYIRCIIGNSANCRLLTEGCGSGETQSPNGALFSSKASCEFSGPPLYDLCYDYMNTPTYEYGKCQLVEVGCSGPLQFKLLSALNDYTCLGTARSPSLLPYIRCQGTGKVVNCRPAPVGKCKPDGSETMVPAGFIYSSLDSCMSGEYQWCYNYDQADSALPGICRLQGQCLTNEKAIGPTTTDSTCLNVPPTTFIRCEIKATATSICRPSTVLTCKPNSAEVIDSNSYSSSTACLMALFQWCYDFTSFNPSSAGTCKQVGTCTGTNEKPITLTSTDSTCTKTVLSNVYYRCIQRSDQTIAKCRPAEAGCSTTGTIEDRNPATIEFTSYDQCNGYAASIIQDCQSLLEKFPGIASGIYPVYLNGPTAAPTNVYCDMTTQGGGWTVIQQRFDGNVDFYRTWNEYKAGFGSLTTGGDFWLGNDIINKLTAGKGQALMVSLVTPVTLETGFAYYSSFYIDDESNKYTLHVTLGCTTIGDSLTYHSNYPFSTKDRDNDAYAPDSCANMYLGAWWYVDCHYSNLNGEYGNIKYAQGLTWYHWKSDYFMSMKTSIMMVRRRPLICPGKK